MVILACMVGVGMILTTHITTSYPLLIITHRKGKKQWKRGYSFLKKQID